MCLCATTNDDDSVAFGIIVAYTFFINLFFKSFYSRVEKMEEDLLKIEFLKGKFEQTDESNENSSYENGNGKDTEKDLLSFNDIA